MKKQIITIEKKEFLVHSTLKLSSYVQVLGFWKTEHGWSKHIVAVNLTFNEFDRIFPPQKD